MLGAVPSLCWGQGFVFFAVLGPTSWFLDAWRAMLGFPCNVGDNAWFSLQHRGQCFGLFTTLGAMLWFRCHVGGIASVSSGFCRPVFGCVVPRGCGVIGAVPHGSLTGSGWCGCEMELARPTWHQEDLRWAPGGMATWVPAGSADGVVWVRCGCQGVQLVIATWVHCGCQVGLPHGCQWGRLVMQCGCHEDYTWLPYQCCMVASGAAECNVLVTKAMAPGKQQDGKLTIVTSAMWGT